MLRGFFFLSKELIVFELIVSVFFSYQFVNFCLCVIFERYQIFKLSWFFHRLFYFEFGLFRRLLLCFLSKRFFQDLWANFCPKGTAHSNFNLFGHAKSTKMDISRSIRRALIELTYFNYFHFFILYYIKPIMIIWIWIFVTFAPIKLEPLIVVILYSHGDIQRWLLVFAANRHILTLELGNGNRV